MIDMLAEVGACVEVLSKLSGVLLGSETSHSTSTHLQCVDGPCFDMSRPAVSVIWGWGNLW